MKKEGFPCFSFLFTLFCLQGLPCNFCRKNLPRRDETVTLVDEEGEEYPVVYLARKNGLSGGWKGFAVAHELVDGDAVVFQLIRTTELKVMNRNQVIYSSSFLVLDFVCGMVFTLRFMINALHFCP